MANKLQPYSLRNNIENVFTQIRRPMRPVEVYDKLKTSRINYQKVVREMCRMKKNGILERADGYYFIPK